MNEWYNAQTDELIEFDPIVPDVWESDNPVIGTLLGPDGDVLVEITERPRRRIGFQP